MGMVKAIIFDWGRTLYDSENQMLFHYIGNLESKSSGTVTKGALKRLQEAGFTRVVRRPEAFGVVAYK